MVAENLAGQPHAGDAFRRERGLLSPGLAFRFSGNELDPAGRTPRAAAARMELIDAGVLFERKDESLAPGHVEHAHTFDGQRRHQKRC
jgi:hypothetical protein